MIHFGAVERHIAERDGRRLCDSKPASERDVSSADWMELREARAVATLCPDCPDKLHPLDVKPELYGMGRMSPAHLYAVPVLEGFDAIRNCSLSPAQRREWRGALTSCTMSRVAALRASTSSPTARWPTSLRKRRTLSRPGS